MACNPLIPDPTPWHGPLVSGGGSITPDLDFGFMVFSNSAGQAISGTSDVKLLFSGVMGRNISFVNNGIQVDNGGQWLLLFRGEFFGTDVTTCTVSFYRNGVVFGGNGYSAVQFNTTYPGYRAIPAMQVMSLLPGDQVHVYARYSTNNANHIMRESSNFAMVKLATNATVFGTGGSGGFNPPPTGGAGAGGVQQPQSPTGGGTFTAQQGSGLSGAGGGAGAARG